MNAKTQKNSIFSKALFKQSCKANGTMWGIITFAVCFMLCCVMLISGSGNIGKTKDAIQDTIIQKEVESSFKTRGVNYYATEDKYLKSYDKNFADETKNTYTSALQAAVLAGNDRVVAAGMALNEVRNNVRTIAQKAFATTQNEITADVTAAYLKSLNKASPDELTDEEKATLTDVNILESVGVFAFAVDPSDESLASIVAQIPDEDKANLTGYVDTEYVTGILTALAADNLDEHLAGRYTGIGDRAEV